MTNPLLSTQCNESIKLGGFARLSIGHSRDIIQQKLQSEIELDELVFIRKENWIAEWQYADEMTTELNINEELNEFGLYEKYVIKTTIQVDIAPYKFRSFWNQKIRGRKLVCKLTSNSNTIRIINPLWCTYTYIGQSNFENLNRYELTFTRAKFNATQLLNRAIIKNITAVTVSYGGPPTNDVTIVLYDNIDTSLFNYGYSISDNPDTIIYQTAPNSNIIYNLKDGEYYFFAVHRILSTYYDVKKVIVQAGQISILNYNPQIITENETTTDEGNFVAE